MILGINNAVWKRVFQLALPAMLGQVATIIYNLADTYFIALTDDPIQIAAVTVSLPVFVIVMAIGTIFSMGGCSMMSRAYGANDTKGIRTLTVLAIYGMILTSVIIGIVGMIFLKPIALLAGADAESLEYTMIYLRYIFLGSPAIMVGNGMVAIFRGHDLVRESAIGLIIGNVVNVIFDFVFIVLMGKGVAGAAFATVLGYAFACVFYFVVMLRKNHQGNKLMTMNPAAFHPTGSMIAELFRVGTPSALVFILICIATMIINNYVGIYGATAVAAYGIAIKLNNIAVNLGNGLAQGVAPRFGFCYGAKDFDELSRTLKASLLFGIVAELFFLVLFIFTGRFLPSLFLSDPTLLHQATVFLIILTSTTFIGTCITVMANYFQSIGKAVPSTVIVFCKNIITFIPAIVVLNHLAGLYGVIFALPLAECLTIIICVAIYLWNRKKIMQELS